MADAINKSGELASPDAVIQTIDFREPQRFSDLVLVSNENEEFHFHRITFVNLRLGDMILNDIGSDETRIPIALDSLTLNTILNIVSLATTNRIEQAKSLITDDNVIDIGSGLDYLGTTFSEIQNHVIMLLFDSDQHKFKDVTFMLIDNAMEDKEWMKEGVKRLFSKYNVDSSNYREIYDFNQSRIKYPWCKDVVRKKWFEILREINSFYEGDEDTLKFVLRRYSPTGPCDVIKMFNTYIQIQGEDSIIRIIRWYSNISVSDEKKNEFMLSIMVETFLKYCKTNWFQILPELIRDEEQSDLLNHFKIAFIRGDDFQDAPLDEIPRLDPDIQTYLAKLLILRQRKMNERKRKMNERMSKIHQQTKTRSEIVQEIKVMNRRVRGGFRFGGGRGINDEIHDLIEKYEST